MTEEKQNDWIEWSGGENGLSPVPAATRIKIQLRNDKSREEIDADPLDVGVASEVDWSHSGFEDGWEVIAYRIVNALASTDRELEA